MACEPIIFKAVTRERWEQIKAHVTGCGIPIAEDTGEAEMSGIRVRYEFDGSTLTVQCIRKPFYYPESKVNDRLRQEFANL